ncbi:flagellar export protein FliJ [Treponema pedis]|uniref:flagellar export protein FliJ n=1 Tax=Treponema pedis TaxID=409322 RepID=UPI00040A4293|nr:flagellar export protein FliJ [Treponema pedis]
MKRFNFRLEKLLHLREFYERKAEIELAHAIAYLDSLKLALKNIANLYAQNSQKLNFDGSTVSIDELHSIQNCIIRLNKEKDELINKSVQAQIVIDEKRKIYIEAASKRKAISKLKEKKLEEWKKENIKAEDDFIDDLVTYKTAVAG